MTTISNTSAASATSASKTTAASKTGLGSLGSTDFLKLMTTQLQQQDPFNPTDNTQMLAQMAQFTSLSQTTEMNSGVSALNEKLSVIADKLDAVLAQQAAAAPSTSTASA